MYLYCQGNGNETSLEFNKNAVLTLVVLIPSKGGIDIVFLFAHFFLAPWNLFEAPKRVWKLKFMSVFVSMNYFRMLGIGRLIKLFSPGIFINMWKNGNTWNLLLQMFRLDSLACVMQKWLRFKGVITVKGCTKKSVILQTRASWETFYFMVNVSVYSWIGKTFQKRFFIEHFWAIVSMCNLSLGPMFTKESGKSTPTCKYLWKHFCSKCQLDVIIFSCVGNFSFYSFSSSWFSFLTLMVINIIVCKDLFELLARLAVI